MLLGRSAPVLASVLASVLALGLVLIAGCPNGDVPDCAFKGPLDGEIVFADEHGVLHDVATEPMVPLIPAPQGGHILLVGAKLHAKASACQVIINAALRDPASGRVIGLEERPMVLSDRGTGWAGPVDPVGLSDVANVAVCPTAVTPKVSGNPFQLEVRVETTGGATLAALTATITPTCASAYCESECKTP